MTIHTLKQSLKRSRETETVSESVTSNIWDAYKFTDSEKATLVNSIYHYDNSDNYSFKKQKISRPVTRSMTKKLESNKPIKNMFGWVSATKTKNYLLDDKCVDWLTLYYSRYGLDDKTDNEPLKSNSNLKSNSSDQNILFQGGNIFESKIYEELKDVYGADFVTVFSESDMKYYHDQHIEEFIRNGNDKVRQLMLKGVPLIAQAPLINNNNMTFGVADLLVRSDYLSALFKTFEPDEDINVKAPLLNGSYHYRVIDAKWTTMTLCVDGVTIRNEGFFPAYKGQVAVYSACLESLQGYIPNCAYIIAKAWKIDKANIEPSQINEYRGFGAFDRPGIVNYKTRDNSYLSKTKNAVQWVQRVMVEGSLWRYHKNAPSVVEMYPNMNKSFTAEYDDVKKTIADMYGDPTMIWYVNEQNRKNAHEQGVFSVRDKRCTSKVLGIQLERGRVIDEILQINQQDVDLVRPQFIKNNLLNWQEQSNLDYYIDFETINYNLFVDPNNMNVDNSYFDSDVTFMIGLGFRHNLQVDSKSILESIELNNCSYQHTIDKKTEWEFVNLYLTDFSVGNELAIYTAFFQFCLKRHELITERSLYKSDNLSRLFHWTDAEVRFSNRAIERMQRTKTITTHKLISAFQDHTEWIDMYKVFVSEPIVVKNAYRFKLKHIGNAFHKHGLINTNWTDGKVSDGFKAMLEAIRLYRKKSITSDSIMDEYKEIIDYNEIDCRVLWEIVNYLRANHIK